MELFSEVNSRYYQLMTEILQMETLEQQQQLLDQHGFKETSFEMLDYLKDDEDSWHLLKNQRSILKNPPQPFPLTNLEKAWLAAIQQESKFSSLGEPFDLEESKPLFDWQDYQYFDQFVSEDRFDEGYNTTIQQLLTSIREKELLRLTYQTIKKRVPTTHLFLALKLEYSAKNNKFRVIGKRKIGNSWKQVTFNCCNIQKVEISNESFSADIMHVHSSLCQIVCELKDQRGALERATFHFSNYRKLLERVDDLLYRMTLFYEKKDETELLINVLSFGARLKVIEPTSFVELIKQRLILQREISSNHTIKMN